MAKKLTTIFQYCFFLGLGIFLIWWSLKGLSGADKQEISHALSRANFWLIVPGIAILLLSHWVRALRWRLIMEPMGYLPSKTNTFFAVLIGYLANQAVPRLGEVLRCSTLTRYEKIPMDKLLGTVILERIVDALSLFCLFIIVIFFQPDLYDNIINTFFSASGGNAKINLLYYAILVIAALAVLVVLLFIVAKQRLLKWLNLGRTILLRVWEGIIAIKDLKRRWAFLLLTILLWALYCCCVYTGFLMLDETRHFGAIEACTVLCAGSLGMIATPGGIGAYAFLVQKTMDLYHVNSGVGLTLGWLLWLVQTGAVIVAGSYSLLALPIYNRKKNNNITSEK